MTPKDRQDSALPLLQEERGRPSHDSPRQSMNDRPDMRRLRSRSPAALASYATSRKYMFAAIALFFSLVSFVVQTETAVYIQKDLGWNKAYCMLYLTHGSWIVLWPVQALFLRFRKRQMPLKAFWRSHLHFVKSTAQMVEHQELNLSRLQMQKSPVEYMVKKTVFIACALTIAGASWYIAVDMTTPSDLTAIYNCSAFFAYAFSVPILKEPLRLDKSMSVLVAIFGVLVIAYGDAWLTPTTPGTAPPPPNSDARNRALGNVIIGVGSILYGLYEVLYKRYACPPSAVSPGRGMVFANVFGSLIGIFTLSVLWIPLPILHFTGIEKFVVPTGKTAALLAISTLSNAVFSGSFLILMSLTSPVLSSVAALLTIFLVAIVDWMITGKPLTTAAVFGGGLICLAFGLLSWSTWKEMKEEQEKNAINIDDDDSDSERDD